MIVADEKRAGTAVLQQAKDKVRAEPFSLVIAHTDGAWRFGPKL